MLECLQKSLRIANSAIEEIVTVQLYCDTLDQYVYYFDRGAPAVCSPLIFLFYNFSPLLLLADRTQIYQQPCGAHHVKYR